MNVTNSLFQIKQYLKLKFNLMMITQMKVKGSEILNNFAEQKQQYEQTIRQLFQQNQKLRRYIQDNAESLSTIRFSSETEDTTKHQEHTDTSQISELISNNLSHTKNPVKIVKYNRINFEELLSQNASLKKQLAELTKIYSEQNKQMEKYRVKISQIYMENESKHQNSTQSQLTEVIKAYQSLLKDFESERDKYIDKIEKLMNQIIRYELRQTQILQNNHHIRLELQIKKQQLRIYRRSNLLKI